MSTLLGITEGSNWTRKVHTHKPQKNVNSAPLHVIFLGSRAAPDVFNHTSTTMKVTSRDTTDITAEVTERLRERMTQHLGPYLPLVLNSARVIPSQVDTSRSVHTWH